MIFIKDLIDIFFKDKFETSSGVINYGNEKNDGSHDHRTNKGNDRTPSQKEGDKKRKN